jgi:hypothetical protein
MQPILDGVAEAHDFVDRAAVPGAQAALACTQRRAALAVGAAAAAVTSARHCVENVHAKQLEESHQVGLGRGRAVSEPPIQRVAGGGCGGALTHARSVRAAGNITRVAARSLMIDPKSALITYSASAELYTGAGKNEAAGAGGRRGRARKHTGQAACSVRMTSERSRSKLDSVKSAREVVSTITFMAYWKICFSSLALPAHSAASGVDSSCGCWCRCGCGCGRTALHPHSL